MARELVKTYSHISEEGQKLFAPEREAVGLCPRCGKPVYEGKKNFYCSDRSCRCLLYTSHVGIYVGDNMMLHCGDPISYTNLNTSYWQSHFYAYGRPPYN